MTVQSCQHYDANLQDDTGPHAARSVANDRRSFCNFISRPARPPSPSSRPAAHCALSPDGSTLSAVRNEPMIDGGAASWTALIAYTVIPDYQCSKSIRMVSHNETLRSSTRFSDVLFRGPKNSSVFTL
jgi:hypothetical protein